MLLRGVSKQREIVRRAKALGLKISPDTVSQMAKGEGHPQADKIAIVAAALDVEGPKFALDEGGSEPDVSALIGQAQGALEAAQHLLNSQATSLAEGAQAASAIEERYAARRQAEETEQGSQQPLAKQRRGRG